MCSTWQFICTVVVSEGKKGMEGKGDLERRRGRKWSKVRERSIERGTHESWFMKWWSVKPRARKIASAPLGIRTLVKCGPGPQAWSAVYPCAGPVRTPQVRILHIPGSDPILRRIVSSICIWFLSPRISRFYSKMKRLIVSVVLFLGVLFTFPRFITADLKHITDEDWENLLEGEWLVMLWVLSYGHG